MSLNILRRLDIREHIVLFSVDNSTKIQNVFQNFSLNFYLGDKIQQFDKVLPQDGVLMIPEEDMPDFLKKYGKDYTFQKVWEVKKTVEWHSKVGFYKFVKTSANIAQNK